MGHNCAEATKKIVVQKVLCFYKEKYLNKTGKWRTYGVQQSNYVYLTTWKEASFFFLTLSAPVKLTSIYNVSWWIQVCPYCPSHVSVLPLPTIPQYTNCGRQLSFYPSRGITLFLFCFFSLSLIRKSEGAVDHSTVTRWLKKFRSCCKNLNNQTTLEETRSLLVCVICNMMEDVKQNLHTGTSKSVFSVETDHLLSEQENTEGESYLKFTIYVQHITFTFQN